MGMGRAILAAVAFIVIAGATALWLSPAARLALATAIHPESRTPSASHGHAHGNGDHHGPPGVLKLSTEQITKAKIELAPAGAGTLTRRINVPGTIAPDADRIGRVAAKVVGTVAELRKRLGDPVAKGEVIAVLESREVADAKSDYLAALVQFDLQKTLFERDQTLWERKIIAEQQFLRARTAFAHAQLRVDMARQKLSALDLSVDEVANLPTQPIDGLRHKDIRAPIAGRSSSAGSISARRSAARARRRSSTSSPTCRRSGSIWRFPWRTCRRSGRGSRSPIASGAKDVQGGQAIVFISPLLNPETRSARVIASLDNPDMAFRPGSSSWPPSRSKNIEVELRVPRTALQTIAGEQVVFVRTEEGFEKREVVVGATDEPLCRDRLRPRSRRDDRRHQYLRAQGRARKSEADHGHAH